MAVFDASWPPALDFCRALGRIGVEVEAYSHERFPAARFSRFASRFRSCPNPEDLPRFQSWLASEVDAGRIQLVAPTSDIVLFHLTELKSPPGLIARSIAPPEALRKMIWKQRFAAACADHGIRTPTTLAPRSASDALSAAKELGFPLILKPRSHVGLGGTRGVVVRTQAELLSDFRPFPIHEGGKPALQHDPDLAWPLLQAFVCEASDGHFSVAGVFDPDGRLLGAIASRKWAQWPRRLGIGTLFEGIEAPELIARGCEIARSLLGRGLFELEFARDSRTGELMALDLNPRGYGQMAMAIAGGLDLPLLWYRSTLDLPLEGSPEIVRGNLAWVHPLLYYVGRLVDVSRGVTDDSAERRRSLRGKRRVHAGWDWRDPVSSLVFFGRFARQIVGITRAHLRPNV